MPNTSSTPKKRVRPTADDLCALAASHVHAASGRAGECLNPEAYVNAKTHLNWRCGCGYEWPATFDAIRHAGSWCPRCAGRAPVTEAELHALAASHVHPETGLAGECLNPDDYRGIAKKLRWRCGCGFEWPATVSSVRHNGSWCPKCSGHSGLEVAELHALAGRHVHPETGLAGECLNPEDYTGIDSKLIWRCGCGFEWPATVNGVKNGGHWCHKCAGKVPLTAAELHALAANHVHPETGLAGECLNPEASVNGCTPLTWRCGCGHEWEAPTNYIRSGSWCHKCAGKVPPTMAELRAEAASRIHAGSGQGGECLNPEDFESGATKLHWRCGCGHEWPARWYNIKAGNWCPKCAKRLAPTLEEMRAYGRAFGLECLAQEGDYLRNTTPLRWLCTRCGNETVKPWAAVKRGNVGCDGCRYKMQAATRALMECVFDAPFPSIEARWLRGTGPRQSYKYDGYNVKLKLAFEYHGYQHVDENAHYYQVNGRTLAEQQERDLFLREGSAAHGVTLIEIWPVTGKNYSSEDFVEHCRPAIEAVLGGPIPQDRIDAFVTQGGDKGELARMREYATAHGGECLSKRYLTVNTTYHWRCSEGHEWSVSWSAMKTGQTWCPHCAHNAPPAADDFHAVAHAHGGECLNPEEYTGCFNKLRWRCGDCQHEWEMPWVKALHRGQWCPECTKKRKKEIARVNAQCQFALVNMQREDALIAELEAAMA